MKAQIMRRRGRAAIIRLHFAPTPSSVRFGKKNMNSRKRFTNTLTLSFPSLTVHLTLFLAATNLYTEGKYMDSRQ
jgi:hypothetical protein